MQTKNKDFCIYYEVETKHKENDIHNNIPTLIDLYCKKDSNGIVITNISSKIGSSNIIENFNKFLWKEKNDYDLIIETGLITKDGNKKLFVHSLFLMSGSTFFRNILNEGLKLSLDGYFINVEAFPNYDSNSNRLIRYIDLSKVLKNNKQNYWFIKAVKSLYIGAFPGIPKGDEIECYSVINKFEFHLLKEKVLAFMVTRIKEKSNICQIAVEASRRNHEEVFKICCKILENYTYSIFNSEIIGYWDLKAFCGLLKNRSFIQDEKFVFDAALEWCKIKAKEYKLPYKYLFKKIESYIRFPLIQPNIIADEIEPLKLVSDNLLEEAYMFHSLPIELRQEAFNCNIRCQRGGFNLPFRWEMSNNLIQSIVLSEDGQCIKMLTNGSRTVFGDKEISELGTYFWEIEMISSSLNCYAMVGVGSREVSYLSYLGNSPHGYALYFFNQTAYTDSKGSYFTSGQSLGAGTKVGIVLHCNSKKNAELYFIINGEPRGRAFSNISLPVRPAVTLSTSSDSLRIVSFPTLPLNWKCTPTIQKNT